MRTSSRGTSPIPDASPIPPAPRVRRGAAVVALALAWLLGAGTAEAGKRHSPAALRILNTYGFPADPSVNEPLELPRGWVDASRQPARALTLGRPLRLPHKSLAVEVGLFLPGKVALLEGSHDAIALHNAAVSLWRKGGQGGLAEAEALLESAQDTVRALPTSSVERASVQLLRGHIALARYVDLLRAGGDRAGSVPSASSPSSPSLVMEDVRAARNRVLSAYADALEHRDVVGLFASPDAAVDGSLLRASLAVGFFPARPQLKSVSLGSQKAARPAFSDFPMDPVRSLRSQAIPALWNLAILQATVNNWQSAFEVAAALDGVFERLGNRAPVFTGEAARPLVDAYDVDTVANAVWLLPRHRADMAASLSLLRAGALGLAGDPVGVLEEADKAIRRADSPLLSATGFHLAADVYTGLGHEVLAARAFEWAQGMDARYAAVVPSLTFFSAENAFWRGERARARAGFTAFLEDYGDPVYGPWARLRLASLAHAEENLGQAALEYERLRRLTPAHPAALEARVRLFCLDTADTLPGAPDLTKKGLPKVRGTQGKRVRTQALSEVLAAVSDAPSSLKEQASACALGTRLALTDEDTQGARTREAREARADALLAHVESFEKEHVKSPFAALHEARKKTLALGREGQKVLAQNDCVAALAFYGTHGERLFSDKDTDTLGEFRWTSSDRVFLARCAFLVGEGELPTPDGKPTGAASKSARTLSKRAMTDAWEPATLALQRALASFLTQPGPTTERRLLDEMGNRDLLAITEKKEKAGKFLVKHPEFWSFMAASRLVAARLQRSSVSLGARSRPQESAFLKKVLMAPAAVGQNEKACLAVVSAFDGLERTQKETVFKSREAKLWLAALEGDAKGDPASQESASCVRLLAHRFLLEARDGRSRLLEESLLLPWLRAKGIPSATDEWLEHAWRLERRKGTRDPEVRALFKRLAKEADNEPAKETARAWLEKNASSGDAVR